MENFTVPVKVCNNFQKYTKMSEMMADGANDVRELLLVFETFADCNS
jgi:hypothetical protein